MREGEVEMVYEVSQFVRQLAHPPSLRRLQQILEDRIKHYQEELAWAQRDLEEVKRKLANEETAKDAAKQETTAATVTETI